MTSVDTIAVILAGLPVSSRFSNGIVWSNRPHRGAIRDLYYDLKRKIHSRGRGRIGQVVRNIDPGHQCQGKQWDAVGQITASLPLRDLRFLRTGQTRSP